jgi:hypothetical protein
MKPGIVFGQDLHKESSIKLRTKKGVEANLIQNTLNHVALRLFALPAYGIKL